MITSAPTLLPGFLSPSRPQGPRIESCLLSAYAWNAIAVRKSTGTERKVYTMARKYTPAEFINVDGANVKKGIVIKQDPNTKEFVEAPGSYVKLPNGNWAVARRICDDGTVMVKAA